MRTPTPKQASKPDYQKAVIDGFQAWEGTQQTPLTLPLTPPVLRELSGHIMKAIKDAGLVVGLDDGTDYAHRI